MSPGFPCADPVLLIAFHPAWPQDAPGPGAHGARSPSAGRAPSRCPPGKARKPQSRAPGGVRADARLGWASSKPRPGSRARHTQSSGAAASAADWACTSFQIPSALSPPDLGAEEHSAFLSLTIKIKQKYILSPATTFVAQFPCLHSEDRNTNKYINSRR